MTRLYSETIYMLGFIILYSALVLFNSWAVTEFYELTLHWISFLLCIFRTLITLFVLPLPFINKFYIFDLHPSKISRPWMYINLVWEQSSWLYWSKQNIVAPWLWFMWYSTIILSQFSVTLWVLVLFIAVWNISFCLTCITQSFTLHTYHLLL